MRPSDDVNDASDADPALGMVERTDTYDNEPLVLRLPDGLLLVYRRADLQVFESWGRDGHVSDDGRIVARRSYDGGRSWTDEAVVANSAHDTRNQSIAYDRDSGRITVFYRMLDAEEYVDGDGAGQLGLYRVSSTDGGRSWSEPVELDWRGDRDQYLPFGGYARVGDELLTFCYGGGAIEATRSADGGREWTDPDPVVDSTAYEGRQLGEPTPCAIGGDRVLAYGRENLNADFWVAASDDGGRSWTAPTFFDPGAMETGTPLAVRRTDVNELTAVWADRTAGALYAARTSVRHAWREPTWIDGAPKATLATMDAESVGDFGYPMLARGPDDRTLVAYYDGSPAPDVFVLPVARS